jgi:hypothetical protein
MPFSMMTYLNHILTANPTFHNVKDSSLDPLNNRLQGAGVGPAVNAGLRQQILEALGLIPFAKQQKYTNALNYMRQQFTLGIPAIPYAYPVNLVHRFDLYEAAPAAWGNGAMDNRQDGWFEHSFRVSWSSSNGNMQNLAQIWNREQVTFIQPAAGPPFSNAVMGLTPQTYIFGINQSSSGGFSLDNHFFMHPSLMLAYPIAAATVNANQEYEYSPDGGQTWYEIPNGQFVFDRGVRNALNGGGLVFYFAKRNRLPGNTRNYRFEVEYPIGAAPANPPANYAAVRGRGTGNSIALNTYATVIARQ